MNIEPEHGVLEDGTSGFSGSMLIFQGVCPMSFVMTLMTCKVARVRCLTLDMLKLWSAIPIISQGVVGLARVPLHDCLCLT